MEPCSICSSGKGSLEPGSDCRSGKILWNLVLFLVQVRFFGTLFYL